MIEVNELRIGNYFKDYSDKYYKWAIEDFSLLTYVEVDEIAKPVELTPEILESAGFEENDLGFKMQMGKFIKTGRWIEREFFASGEKIKQPFLRFDMIVDLYYLHQLQNFYYLLSGKELQINLQTITKCHTPKITNS